MVMKGEHLKQERLAYLLGVRLCTSYLNYLDLNFFIYKKVGG